MRPYILPILLFFMVLTSCDKIGLDYRNKWVGDWQLDQIVYDYSGQTSYHTTANGQVEKGDGSNEILINGYQFNVDRDGKLTQPEGFRSGGGDVGHISKRTLTADFNTSAGVNPGAQIMLLGSRE